MDLNRALVLGFERACAVCGYALSPGRPVYRAFSQRDAAQIRLHEADTLASEFSGPGHLSCMLYSVNVCPHMREPTARLGKDSKVSPGARRGQRAALMGFSDFILMLASELDATGDTPSFYFGYLNLVDDRKYAHGSELVGELPVAISDDAPTIDMTRAPLYWSSGAQDEQRLRRASTATSKAIVPLRRPYPGATIAGVKYYSYALPKKLPAGAELA